LHPRSKPAAVPQAKNVAIRAGDPEQSYKVGMQQFLDQKTYRPMYQPFKLGTLISDQTKK
jgi:trans-feruloyl-CoA hydratase/vanillin synthase